MLTGSSRTRPISYRAPTERCRTTRSPTHANVWREPAARDNVRPASPGGRRLPCCVPTGCSAVRDFANDSSSSRWPGSNTSGAAAGVTPTSKPATIYLRNRTLASESSTSTVQWLAVHDAPSACDCRLGADRHLPRAAERRWHRRVNTPAVRGTTVRFQRSWVFGSGS
jgi:hypothetical protein